MKKILRNSIKDFYIKLKINDKREEIYFVRKFDYTGNLLLVENLFEENFFDSNKNISNMTENNLLSDFYPI